MTFLINQVFLDFTVILHSPLKFRIEEREWEMKISRLTKKE